MTALSMLFVVHFAGVNPRTNLAQERRFKGMLRRHVTIHLDGIEVLVAVRTHVGTGFADGTACRGGGGDADLLEHDGRHGSWFVSPVVVFVGNEGGLLQRNNPILLN